MAELPGDQWLLLDTGPALYLQYQWDRSGGALHFSGMDRDGYAIAGRYALDPRTNEITGLSARRGAAIPASVELIDSGFVVTTEDSETLTRQTYRRAGAGSFSVTVEERQRGRAGPVRTLRLVQASPEVIATLGWVARTPDSEAADAAARAAAFGRQPSFGRRLSNAFQDGVVVGVHDGVRDGVQEVTREAITGDEVRDHN
jgi:hypothetical protein